MYCLCIPCLEFKKRILIGHIDQLIITLTTPICNHCQCWISFLTVFSHNSRIIVRIGSQEVFWVIIGVYDYLSKCIMDMNILTSLANKMLQKLGKELQAIPGIKKEIFTGKCSPNSKITHETI